MKRILVVKTRSEGESSDELPQAILMRCPGSEVVVLRSFDDGQKQISEEEQAARYIDLFIIEALLDDRKSCFPLVTYVARQWPKTPIIVVSGADVSVDAEEVYRLLVKWERTQMEIQSRKDLQLYLAHDASRSQNFWSLLELLGTKLKPRPAKLLLAGAESAQMARVMYTREFRSVEDQLCKSPQRSEIEIVPLYEMGGTRLAQQIKDTRPLILHLACHGEQDGKLILEDNGHADELKAADLRTLLEPVAAPSVRLCVINACFGALPAESVGPIVGCAIGPVGQIAADDASRFAEQFYSLLFHGFSVGHAVRMAEAVAGLPKDSYKIVSTSDAMGLSLPALANTARANGPPPGRPEAPR